MGFPWSGKRETGEMNQPQETLAVCETSQTRSHPLEKATELLGQANEQIAAYLVQYVSETAGLDGEMLRSLERKLLTIGEKLERLDSRLTSLPQGSLSSDSSTGIAVSTLQEVREAVQKQGEALSLVLVQLQEQIQSDFQEIARLVCPFNDRLQALAERLTLLQDGERSPSTTFNDSEWAQAILGPTLTGTPSLSAERQSLIDGILSGHPGACTLAGQLLVFQSAPIERLPQLLKDIGEAYYHWQPKTQPGIIPMEEALVRWLQHRCEEAGLANTIELVHPGERFDASRHHTAARGVEITAVHGWIILRDNGKVYMKATVSVR